MAKYRLKIKRLDFVSPVDRPAQETAKVLLTKGAAGALKFSAFAPVVKLSETTDDDGNAIGLVFCWAVTEKAAGQDYYDLQGDQVMADDDLIRAALDYVKRGAVTDEMHDGDVDGFAPFVMPLTAEVAKAFGINTTTTGLMVGLKPSADVFAKFQSGEYTGVSIEGTGERTKVAARKESNMQTKCEKCGSFAKDSDATCPSCGAAMPEQKRAPEAFRDASGAYVETADGFVCATIGKRKPLHRETITKDTWTTATVDDLPDSSFLYIEGGGSKDSDGKTTPRSLRHFPYKDENGKIDLPHLRDAISRIPQSSLPATLRNKLQVKAEKLLAAQHTDSKRAGAIVKNVLATTAVAGHTHLLSDNGEPDGYTDYAVMPGADDGGWHQHPWLRAPDGTVLVLEAEGHAHEVMSEDDLAEIVDSGRENDIDEDDTPQKRNRKSTHASAGSSVTTKKDESMIILSEAQHAHYLKLDEKGREAFVKMSPAERDGEIKKTLDADPVVYKAADGTEYRKSAGDAAIALVKRVDDAEKTANVEKAARLDIELTKRAETEFSKLAGTLETKKDILRALEGIADEPRRKAAIAAVKGGADALGRLMDPANHRLREGFELPAGVDGAGESPLVKADADLKKKVEAYRAEKKLATYEIALSKALVHDPEIRRLYELTRN